MLGMYVYARSVQDGVQYQLLYHVTETCCAYLLIVYTFLTGPGAVFIECGCNYVTSL